MIDNFPFVEPEKSEFREGKYGQYNRCKTDYQTCNGCGD